MTRVMKKITPIVIVVGAFVNLACGQASELLLISDIPVPPAATEVRDRSGFLGPTDAVSFELKTPRLSLTVIEFYDEWANDIGWSRLSKSDDIEVSVEWEDTIESRSKRNVLRYRAVWLSLDNSQKMTVVVSCNSESPAGLDDVQDVLVMLMRNKSEQSSSY